MAVIKLTIQPDKASLESTIKTINDALGNIKGLNIKVDSGAQQATQSLAANLQKAADAASNVGSSVSKVITTYKGLEREEENITKIITETNEALGKRSRVIETIKDKQHSYTTEVIQDNKEIKKSEEELNKAYVQGFTQREKEIEKKQQETWKAFLAGEKEYRANQQKLENEKVEQAAAANRQMVLDEEAAMKQRSAAWKAYFDNMNEEIAAQEKANKAREAAAQTSVTLEKQYSNLIRQIQNLKAQYPEGTFDEIETQAREAREELRKLDRTSEDYAERVKMLQGTYQGLQRDMANTRQETNKLDKVTESFWMNIQKFARWYIGGNFVVKIVNSLREALKTMKEVDTELANIQKVTDRTDAEMQKLADSAYRVASAYGVSAQQYLESAAEFAKAGFGDQAEELAEVAIKTQLVGDVSADVADKFLIASNAAWKMNGNIDALNKTLDAANTIENNYATSIEKLAAGMPIAASVAANAGMTFEETIAALGTITSVTQETGTKAATALRALILNIIGAVGEYEDGIEVTEESVKSLDGILQVYAKDAMAAAQAAGTVINPMEAIAALAKASEEGLVNQAELFEILSSLGGKLRTNQLISLVQNYGTYLEMLDKTKESAGSAEKEIGVMLDTWEAKTNILKNTWTEFISKTVETDVIKFFLDAATALVDFADNAGLAAMAAGGLMAVFKGKEIVGGIKDAIKLFKNLGEALKSATMNMTAATTALGLMTAAISVGVMVYKSIQQAREEATQKAVSEGKEIGELAEKYGDIITKVEDETLKREELQEVLKNNVDKYAEEYDGIQDVNELRRIGIDLINEETKAKAKQYTLENAGAYRRAERYLRDANAVTVADFGGVSISMGAYEAQAFLEKQIEAAKKVENPTKAQIAALETLSEKYQEVTKDIEDSQAVIEAYTTAQELLNGTYEITAKETDDVSQGTRTVTSTVKSLHDVLKEASDAATAYDEAIGGVVDAMDNFGAGSVEVYDAMQALEAVMPGSTDKIYDFHTATLLVDQSLFEDKESVLDLIDAMRQVDFSEAINEAERAAEAAWDMAEAWSNVLPMMGGVFANAAMASSAYAGSVKSRRDEWNSRVSALRQRSAYSGGSGGSGSTASTADPELERLKNIVSLRKAELSFLEASGKSEEEINAKRKEIQAALHDQAEYMRSIEADEEDILALSTEWWNIQNQINDSLAKADEERIKALEEQKKLQEEMFDTIRSLVDDYYAKIIDDKSEELSLEEKILAVQKAEAALANAQAERNVRYYNASTGQWEWAANAKNVKSAQDALKKAQDDLSKYQRDQAWKAFKSAWEYVAEQIKSGAMTFREAYDYMYDAMKGIQDKYGVDLGMTLEDSIGGFKNLNYGIDGLTQEVADSLGASVGMLNERLKQYEAAVDDLKKAFDEASEKVKNGELEMEDAYGYLRDRAKEIADKYGIDMTGALEDAIAGMDKTNMSIDELWKAVVINLMKVNSARWFDATPEEKQMLHAQNEYLGKLIGATYDPSGYWYLGGSQLYGSQKGASTGGASYGSGGGGSGGGGGGGGGSYGGGASGGSVSGNGTGAAASGEFHYGNNPVGTAGYNEYWGVNGDDWASVFWDADKWAYYSKLAEATPEEMAKFMQWAAADKAGAGSTNPEAWKELYNASIPGGSTFPFMENANGDYMGFVRVTAGYGVLNGELLRIYPGMTNVGAAYAGTIVQGGNGRRWEVGQDGSLNEIAPAFDRGGILRGLGGIKATLRDEMVLDPDMTQKILDPVNNDLSRRGRETLRNLLGIADILPQPIDNSIGTQNNGAVYNFGGISIGEAEARSTTVYELARLAGALGISKNS